MKIVLLKTIEKLGKKGNIVEVKDGFARNYLLPKGQAQEATLQNLHLLKVRENKEKRLKEKQEKLAQHLAEEISKLSLTLPCRVKDNEELFGSVNSQMIASALEAEGYKIEKEKIILPEPIKRLGIYNIKLKLSSQVEAEFKLWVVKK